MDRNKFERMLVWDDKEKTIECIVISKHGEFCVAVDSDNEGFFLDKNYPIEDVCVVLYRYCKPIPKKPKKIELDLKVVVEDMGVGNYHKVSHYYGDKCLHVEESQFISHTMDISTPLQEALMELVNNKKNYPRNSTNENI